MFTGIIEKAEDEKRMLEAGLDRQISIVERNEGSAR
jgi:hypothetical protein